MLCLAKARKNLNRLKRSLQTPPRKLPDFSKYPVNSDKDQISRETNYQPVEPETIKTTLTNLGIKNAQILDYWIGPSVTTYEVKLPIGTKISSLMGHELDLARDLNVRSLRIVENLPTSTNIGIEIPNTTRFPVLFKDLIAKAPKDLAIPILLGEDNFGTTVYKDLTTMPHLLIAGMTGSGKSVALNNLIATILCTRTPEQVKFLMVDPKKVELVDYQNVPHLLSPIAYENEDALSLLDTAIELMDDRFELLSKERCKKLIDYNDKTGEDLPYVVFVIDEYADLMLSGKPQERKEIEQKIARLAQKARAVGIHLVLATQKPIVAVVTSLLKANLPARMAFQVASGNDSRVILDDQGAERLIGSGDMLFLDPTAKEAAYRIRRIQSPWIGESEINYITGR